MKTISAFLITFLIILLSLKTSANLTENKFSIQKIEPVHVQKDTTPVDVSGDSAIFIGDSHTANHYWGWQKILCDNTGLKMTNVSVGGKITAWMLTTAKKAVSKKYDYCFIYGGANDMYGSVKATTAVKNIQGIVDICNVNKVQAIVVTGFNPFDCVVTPYNPGYPKRYADFQQMLLDSIKGAKVIDTRKAVIRKDCGDAICHMNHSGHRKMAETIIEKMNLKTKTTH